PKGVCSIRSPRGQVRASAERRNQSLHTIDARYSECTPPASCLFRQARHTTAELWAVSPAADTDRVRLAVYRVYALAGHARRRLALPHRLARSRCGSRPAAEPDPLASPDVDAAGAVAAPLVPGLGPIRERIVVALQGGRRAVGGGG